MAKPAGLSQEEVGRRVVVRVESQAAPLCGRDGCLGFMLLYTENKHLVSTCFAAWRVLPCCFKHPSINPPLTHHHDIEVHGGVSTPTWGWEKVLFAMTCQNTSLSQLLIQAVGYRIAFLLWTITFSSDLNVHFLCLSLWQSLSSLAGSACYRPVQGFALTRQMGHSAWQIFTVAGHLECWRKSPCWKSGGDASSPITPCLAASPQFHWSTLLIAVFPNNAGTNNDLLGLKWHIWQWHWLLVFDHQAGIFMRKGVKWITC